MMRRLAVSVLLVAVTVPAFAQARQEGPARPAGEPIQGEPRLRWILDRLELTADQREQAEALIDVYRARMQELEANASGVMERVRDLYAELVRAKAEVARLEQEAAAGKDVRKELDAAKAQAATAEQSIRDAAPGTKAENEFFDSLAQSLTDPQKARLPQLKLQAGSVRSEPPKPPPPPAGPGESPRPAAGVTTPPAAAAPAQSDLRPIQILSAARQLSLTIDQLRRLEPVLDDYRTKARTSPVRDAATTNQLVQGLREAVRKVLTPEQIIEFDRRIKPPTSPLTTAPTNVEARRLTPEEVKALLGGAPATQVTRPPATQPADAAGKKTP